jgi:hypothetical protein
VDQRGPRFPAGSASRKRRTRATRFPAPAGIRAGDHRPRLPARRHAVAAAIRHRASGDGRSRGAVRVVTEARSTRSLTVAGAAQVGAPATAASCFPFNCVRRHLACMHRSGASVGAGLPSVKKRAARVCGRHAVPQARAADPCPAANNPLAPRASPVTCDAFRGKKRGCYVWIRYKSRNAGVSALKCPVFRGRSRCSTNSKPYPRTLAA